MASRFDRNHKFSEGIFSTPEIFKAASKLFGSQNCSNDKNWLHQFQHFLQDFLTFAVPCSNLSFSGGYISCHANPYKSLPTHCSLEPKTRSLRCEGRSQQCESYRCFSCNTVRFHIENLLNVASPWNCDRTFLRACLFCTLRNVMLHTMVGIKGMNLDWHHVIAVFIFRSFIDCMDYKKTTDIFARSTSPIKGQWHLLFHAPLPLLSRNDDSVPLKILQPL